MTFQFLAMIYLLLVAICAQAIASDELNNSTHQGDDFVIPPDGRLSPPLMPCPAHFLVPPNCIFTYAQHLGRPFHDYRIAMLTFGSLLSVVTLAQVIRIFQAGGACRAAHDTSFGFSVQFSLHLRLLVWSIVFVCRMVDPNGLFAYYNPHITKFLEFAGIAVLFSIILSVSFMWLESRMQVISEREAIIRARHHHMFVQILVLAGITVMPLIEHLFDDNWSVHAAKLLILASFALGCEIANLYYSMRFYFMLKSMDNMESRIARVRWWIAGSFVTGSFGVLYLGQRAISILVYTTEDVERSFFTAPAGMADYFLIYGLLHLVEVSVIFQVLIFYRRIRTSSLRPSRSQKKGSFSSTPLLYARLIDSGDCSPIFERWRSGTIDVYPIAEGV